MTSIVLPKNTTALLHHNDVMDIVAPLRDLLGLNYFCFRRIYDNGAHVVLTTSPEWLLKYYSNHYFKKTEVQKMGLEKSFYPVIWDYTNKDKFSETAINDSISFNFMHSLSLKYIGVDYMDLYSIAAPAENSQINEKYLNFYESIKRFTFYFQSKAAILISQAQKTPIYVNVAKKKYDADYFAMCEFEQKIKLSQLNINVDGSLTKFTPKETQCLKSLKAGLSCKEIAKNLGISPRTVEVYINNIKLKLNVYSKANITSIINRIEFNPDLIT